ncbi:hypothetical protein [Staphylococcus capitis]|uniref:hypothetical protein n=1 Tax=Staphylococcus capitis TaxID=29388 RepID=UPI000D1BFB1A|nr:hypothetical protein [Staphylococcus capitis]PTH39461.1 hypothetical protein BU619_08150 [Staphylococcus capitis]
MHSPIVYIIKQDSDYAKSLRGQLPKENHMDDEDLFDYIEESDWLNANTLTDAHWHRNHWNESFKDLLASNKYHNLDETKNGDLILSFDQSHIKNWYKRILELNEERNCNINKYLDNKIEKKASFFPYNNFEHYLEAKEITGNAYGGTRYVLYVTSPTDATLEMYDVLNLNELINYVDSELSKESKSVEFQICKNIVGDYHY